MQGTIPVTEFGQKGSYFRSRFRTDLGEFVPDRNHANDAGVTPTRFSRGGLAWTIEHRSTREMLQR